MKQLKTVLLSIAILVAAGASAQMKTEKIRVEGNCGGCKKKIEAASKVDGVATAEWNTKTKWLNVTYDPAKTTGDAIQKNVAAAGYDTEKYAADDKAYSSLEECCQYERKKGVAKKQ